MDVHLITDAEVSQCAVEDLPELLERRDGLVWLDIPSWTREAAKVLAEVFGFHPLAIQDCGNRNHVPEGARLPRPRVPRPARARARARAATSTTSSWTSSSAARYLVTVHGPLNPGSARAVALRETAGVSSGWRPGGCARPPRSSCRTRSSPRSPAGRRRSSGCSPGEVGLLEQRVMGGEPRGSGGVPRRAVPGPARAARRSRPWPPQRGRSTAACATLTSFGPPRRRPLLATCVDQFERVTGWPTARWIPAGRDRVLPGPDRHQDDHRRRAAGRDRRRHPADHRHLLGLRDERHRQRPHPRVQLAVVLAIMAAMSGTLLRWAKRQGWW